MRLTKRTSVAIMLAMIAIFFIITSIATKFSEKKSDESDPKLDFSDPRLGDTKTAIILNEFNRSFTKNGKKIWEITGTKAEFLPEKKAAKIQAAKMHFYQDNGEIIDITCEQALLYIEGTNLSKADLVNNVVLEIKDKLKIETDFAEYSGVENSVSAPGNVNISSKMSKVTGAELKGDLELQKFTLMKDIKGEIIPKKKQ